MIKKKPGTGVWARLRAKKVFVLRKIYERTGLRLGFGRTASTAGVATHRNNGAPGCLAERHCSIWGSTQPPYTSSASLLWSKT